MFLTECHKRVLAVFLPLFLVTSFVFSQSITRKIEKLYSGTGYLVTLSIYKNGIQGFAKIVEIPSDPVFKAEATPGSPGIFTINGSEVRILFTALPETDSFTVSYSLYCNSALSISGIL